MFRSYLAEDLGTQKSRSVGGVTRRRSTRVAARAFRLKKEPAPFGLSTDDVEYLKRNTRYDEKEIREWYSGFHSDCPDGNLQKAKTLQMYNMILPSGDASVFVDQMFRIFDKDGNGTIDFREFMLATDMTRTGSPQEKLKWAFKLYDRDGSGSIDLSEMCEAVSTLCMMEGVEETRRAHLAASKAEAIFKQLDVDGDGYLTEDEFVRGCLRDAEFVEILSTEHKDNEDSEDKE